QADMGADRGEREQRAQAPFDRREQHQHEPERAAEDEPERDRVRVAVDEAQAAADAVQRPFAQHLRVGRHVQSTWKMIMTNMNSPISDISSAMMSEGRQTLKVPWLRRSCSRMKYSRVPHTIASVPIPVRNRPITRGLLACSRWVPEAAKPCSSL